LTTITIDDETKENLLKIAAQLQMKRRQKMNYNNTIRFLIENYTNKKDKEKLRRACAKIEHVDIDDVLNELYQERKKDEISF